MATDDLLYTNAFVSNPAINAGYGLTEELRKFRLRTHVEDETGAATPDVSTPDPTRLNPVITEDGELKQLTERRLMKESRLTISIDSRDREILTYGNELDSPEPYRPYLLEENYTSFADLYALAKTDVTVLAGPLPMMKQVPSLPSTTSIDYLEDEAPYGLYDSSNEAIVNSMNILVMSSAAIARERFWCPFYIENGEIRQILYKEQTPQKYTIRLVHPVSNVKSIRLLNSVIPNTVSNITERNNLLVLRLQYTTDAGVSWTDIVPDLSSLFDFILVRLDVGCYTLDTLVSHLEDKLNEAILAYVPSSIVVPQFTVTLNKNSGGIWIRLGSSESDGFRFHLKFYAWMMSRPEIALSSGEVMHGPVRDYARDLWYMLGFPWPYYIDSSGNDLYSWEMSNVVNYKVHDALTQPHTETDIFRAPNADLQTVINARDYLIPGDRSNIINVYRPYRYPDISIPYIFMVIDGLRNFGTVDEFPHSGYDGSDAFAKFTLNVAPGEMAYNTFVRNPYVFLNMKDKIDHLDISWLDNAGNPVDFNGVDHVITLEFISYVHDLDTNRYSSKLGFIDTKSYPDYLSGGAGAA